eukprot:4831951-Prorocentrum_lima.AAC.1
MALRSLGPIQVLCGSYAHGQLRCGDTRLPARTACLLATLSWALHREWQLPLWCGTLKNCGEQLPRCGVMVE